jgi:hypothetical protein
MAIGKEESRLRHRFETPVFIFSAFLNAALMIGAILIAMKSTDTAWLKAHPGVAGNVRRFRVAAIAAILLAPGLIVLRNTRRVIIGGNSLRVSETQLGPVYDLLRLQCRQLGMRVPVLYVTDRAISEPSDAYTARDQDYIVLNARYLPANLEVKLKVIDFFLARELGAIRLGHTKWWNEILVAYIDRIPMLRNPLSHVRTFSRDRYGAFLTTQGLLTIVVLASGPKMLGSVNIEEYITQAERNRGFWFWLSGMSRKLPSVSQRVAELNKSGLFHSDDRREQSGSSG